MTLTAGASPPPAGPRLPAGVRRHRALAVAVWSSYSSGGAGQPVEAGTHAELLISGTVYPRLWQAWSSRGGPHADGAGA